MPASTPTLGPLTLYESEAVIYLGIVDDPRTSDTLNDPTTVTVVYADVNLIEYTTGSIPMDIEEIAVFKLIDRVDTVPVTNPYAFEACVAGTGIQSATVTPPSASPIPLLLDLDDGYCFSQNFVDLAALNGAFPNGLYAFDITGTGGGSDSKTLNMQASEPGALADVTNPLDGAAVPADQDLTMTWMLVEKSNGVGCIVGMSCTDQIFLEIEETVGMNSSTLIDVILPPTDTQTLILAADLNEGGFYDVEIETFIGAINFSDTTDMSDPVRSVAIFEDINQVTFSVVPEPAAGLAGIAALLTVVALRRRQSSGTSTRF